MQSQGGLLDTPSDAYLEATFQEVGQTKQREFSWRADPSLKLVVDEGAQDFSWAEKRNARRRQQAAKRQDAA